MQVAKWGNSLAVRLPAELVLWNFWLLRQKGAAARHRKLRGSGGGGVVRSLVLQDRGRVWRASVFSYDLNGYVGSGPE